MEIKDIIEGLSSFKSDKYPVTSLYLKLGPKERENLKYRILVKNLIKQKKEEIERRDYGKSEIESIEEDLKKISAYLETPDRLVGCRGAAIFSCAGEGLWEVFKLPLIYRNRLVVDSNPLIRQLAAISDEFGDMVAAIIDRKKARLFRINLNGPSEVAEYFYSKATRRAKFRTQEGRSISGGERYAHGYGEYGFQRMIEDELHQHLKHVADETFSYYKDNKFNWLIAGGGEKYVGDFINHLHTYLREKLLGTVPVDVNTVKPSEIMEIALDLMERKERETEKKIIREFEENMPHGLCVSGVKGTLSALMKGQVRMLLFVHDFSHPGFRCPQSRYLVTEDREDLCPEGQKPIPIRDVVDEAIEEALGQGSEVKMIFDERAKTKIGGIGAILRFKL